MVKQTFFFLAALASVADARPSYDYDEPPPPDDSIAAQDEQPGFNMFGFDMQIGTQPHDGKSAVAMSLGLGVEHPVFKRTRVFAEYAWQWIMPGEDIERAQASMVPRPERQVSGHRASIGLRRELKAKDSGSMRMFIDGELGASVALINDSMEGVDVLPTGFVGMRMGYDLYSRRDDSPSRTFETALLLRFIGTGNGLGFTFGIGMFWGN